MAGLQLDACIPNVAIQEFSTGFEANVFTTTQKHLGHDVVDAAPEPVGARISSVAASRR